MCEVWMSREGVEKAWLGDAADFKMGHFHLEMVTQSSLGRRWLTI